MERIASKTHTHTKEGLLLLKLEKETLAIHGDGVVVVNGGNDRRDELEEEDQVPGDEERLSDTTTKRNEDKKEVILVNPKLLAVFYEMVNDLLHDVGVL